MLTIMGAVPGAARAAGAPPVATTAGGAGLTAARSETYRALAETVVTDPAMRLAPGAADAAAAQFAAAYATWSPEAQRRADGILDALERSPGRSFARLDARGRGEHLRACARPANDDPVGPERGRMDLAEQALSLAAVAVGPSGGELDRPMVTV